MGGCVLMNPIHQGMIDDSDVMSLLIDVEKPGRMYASACSGIYQSDDGAGQKRARIRRPPVIFVESDFLGRSSVDNGPLTQITRRLEFSYRN